MVHVIGRIELGPARRGAATAMLSGLLVVGSCVMVGCGGDALVEISAADAIEAIAAHSRLALNEYHGDLARADDSREAAVVDAFVRRVQADVADESKLDGHSLAFSQALARLRADREVAWTRHSRAEENNRELEQIAADMRRLAMQSLSLRDEWQRYIERLIETTRRPPANPPAATGAPPP